MSETESEHDRRVREYWAAAYNNDNHKQAGLPLQYEPTALLTSQKNTKKTITLKDLLDFDLSR